jgi:5'-nucleotidase
MGRSLPGHYNCAITRHTLNIDDMTYTAYAVDGSPAQVVLHAILSLADRRLALVVAGINHGENLGTGTTVSGTVGAALQAGDMGVPGLAVSLEVPRTFHYNHDSGDQVDWSTSIHFTRCFAQRLLAHGLPGGVHAVKVDIPAEATPQTPWRVTRQALQPYYGSVAVEGELRFGVPRPLIYDVYIDWEKLEPDSDIWAFVRDRVVSVTPLTLDLSGGIDLTDFDEIFSPARAANVAPHHVNADDAPPPTRAT